MSTPKTPTAFTQSGYEREENDRYWTHAKYTGVLVPHLKDVGVRRAPAKGKSVMVGDKVWECAAGRGDMGKELRSHGFTVVMTDISPKGEGIRKLDFLEQGGKAPDAEVVITNPPYGRLAEKFVRRAITMDGISVACFLLRSGWKCPASAGSKRSDFFTKESSNGMRFAMEIVLPERPYWDWWQSKPKTEEKKSVPFHPYSWFVWSSKWKGEPVTRWGKFQ